METSTLERMINKVQAELEATLRDVPKDYRGLHFSRTLTSFAPDPISQKMEWAFAVMWAQNNSEDNGTSALQNQLISLDNADDFNAYQEEFVPESAREWEIAHLVANTMMQWLGTEAGIRFIQDAFEAAGGEVYFRLPSSKLPVSE